jgi:GT2 family glycosyltransferase
MRPYAAWLRPKWHRTPTVSQTPAPPGISTVIPSRNGRRLLETQFPTLLAQQADFPVELLVVDNGSDDGTAEWLARERPDVRVLVSPEPLSFARAVNRGIVEARYSRVCLLNNDMLLEPGFFAALWRAFAEVPDLFCATAQIHFPEGARREETGKAVMAQSSPEDFPVRCDEPLPGEDGTWVLYGSGGCSLYDAAKLRALGNLDEAYEPAYVEDMDIGWRAWQQGWPTVYVAGAAVEHRHRATTSRYYTEKELEHVLEINYLRFLVRAVDSGPLFRRLWREAIERYRRTGRGPSEREAARLIREGGRLVDVKFPEEEFLAFTDGSVAVFPGMGQGVRVLESDRLETPPAGLLARYRTVVVTSAKVSPGLSRVIERRWPATSPPASPAGPVHLPRTT